MLAAYGGESSQAPALRLRVNERERAAADMHVLEVVAESAGRELGARTLPVQTRDCDALPNTLALVLVLLAQSAEAPPPTAARFALSAGAQVLLGVLPRAALGLQLQAATVWRPVAIRLSASALLPQALAVAEGSIHWQSYELALEACSAGLQPLERLTVRLCGGPRAGLMYARSERFALQTEGASAALLYMGLLPEVSLRLGDASWLQLGAGVALALMRPRFFVALDGGDRVRVFDDPAPVRAELTLSWTQIF